MTTYPQPEGSYPHSYPPSLVPTESTNAEIEEALRRNHQAGVIHLSTEPATELLNLEPTSKPSRNGPSDDAPDVLRPTGAIIHRGHVPDRWPYLLRKLADFDEAWEGLSIGALVKIARASSKEAVSYALAMAELSRPVLRQSAYGWLRATACSFEKGDPE